MKSIERYIYMYAFGKNSQVISLMLTVNMNAKFEGKFQNEFFIKISSLF